MSTRSGTAGGSLDWTPLRDHLDRAAAPVAAAAGLVPDALVATIDHTLADTAAFCEAYEVAPEHSANCVVVTARRGEVTRYAAVMVLATMRADVNGVVRKALDARKCSFAARDEAVALTAMEFGGITPVGVPGGWTILVDEAVLAAGDVVVGSGLRRSKLLLPAAGLMALPGARRLTLAS